MRKLNCLKFNYLGNTLFLPFFLCLNSCKTVDFQKSIQVNVRDACNNLSIDSAVLEIIQYNNLGQQIQADTFITDNKGYSKIDLPKDLKNKRYYSGNIILRCSSNKI